MQEIFWRVLIGGIAVCSFSILGDLLKPKSFAGLLSAAPSVALATLLLALKEHDRVYTSIEARSMIFGGVGFLIYASVVSRFLIRGKLAALPVTVGSWVVWLLVSGSCFFLLR